MRKNKFVIRYKNKTLNLREHTAIMGILNVTPDSFSDGGLYYKNPLAAANRAKRMLSEGAEIIDIGGESTRPGSRFVSEKEELSRILPVIKRVKKLRGNFFISVDTRRANVAEKALMAGADMINSLSGFSFDERLVNVVKKFGCPVIIYHIKGTPKTMQKGKIVYKDVVSDITRFFKSQVALARSNGIQAKQIIIDPGIGFGKTLDQNVELISRLGEFSALNLPIMIGVSRKSHLGLLMKKEMKLDYVPGPAERLGAALAETAVAVMNGASIVRTHDVKETREFLASFEVLERG